MVYPVRSHRRKKSVVTTNYEKSAEVIVLRNREGLNNSKRQFEMYVSNSEPDKMRNRSVFERKHHNIGKSV